MSSVRRVPETASMAGDEIAAEDAWRVLRRHGLRRTLGEAFLRFRYGDGFSHARALGLQLCLGIVPLVIAVSGLSGTLGARAAGRVIRRTILTLSPGSSDELVRAALNRSLESGGGTDETALWLGAAVALVALTTAMGQVERGANRIYGVQRDRPSREKYLRSLVLAFVAGAPALVGVLLLVAAEELSDSVEQTVGMDDDVVSGVVVSLGVGLVMLSITVLLRHAPFRRQPGWSWLAAGGGVTLAMWLALTALLAAYLKLSTLFSVVYGPLTGVMALLLWAELTSLATYFGMAFAAQLEAIRSGVFQPMVADDQLP